MSVTLVRLRVEHAAKAAAIHAEGQPGTFLTGLGPAFLKAMYAEMARSPLCFGHVALDENGTVIGVIVGTGDESAVFKQMIWRRGWRLAGPVSWALVKQPRLLKQVWETLSYPSQAQGEPDQAELFFIGTRANSQRRGVGTMLFEALAQDARQLGKRSLGLTVDDANKKAQHFYQQRGMRPEHTIMLYDRTMHWYSLPLSAKRED